MDKVGPTKAAKVCAGLEYCIQVVINDESNFSSIPFGQSLDSKAKLVSEMNGLRYLGYIVTLEDSSR